MEVVIEKSAGINKNKMATNKAWLFKAGEDKVLLVDHKKGLQNLYDILECKHVDCVCIETHYGIFSIWFNDMGVYEETKFNKTAKQVLGKLPIRWGTFNGNFLVTLNKTWEKGDKEEVELDMPKISFKDWIVLCSTILNASIKRKQAEAAEIKKNGGFVISM